MSRIGSMLPCAHNLAERDHVPYLQAYLGINYRMVHEPPQAEKSESDHTVHEMNELEASKLVVDDNDIGIEYACPFFAWLRLA